MDSNQRNNSRAGSIPPRKIWLNRFLNSISSDNQPAAVLDRSYTQPLLLLDTTDSPVAPLPSDETIQNLTVVDDAMNFSLSSVTSSHSRPPLTPSIEDIHRPQQSSTPFPQNLSEPPSFSLSSAQVLDEWHEDT